MHCGCLRRTPPHLSTGQFPLEKTGQVLVVSKATCLNIQLPKDGRDGIIADRQQGILQPRSDELDGLYLMLHGKSRDLESLL